MREHKLNFMAIPIEEVERLAKLTRLKFSDDEKQKLQTELSSILGYADQLQQISEAAPMADWSSDEGVNLMRDDVAEDSVLPEDLLKQAPATEGRFLKVKSVLE